MGKNYLGGNHIVDPGRGRNGRVDMTSGNASEDLHQDHDHQAEVDAQLKV